MKKYLSLLITPLLLNFAHASDDGFCSTGIEIKKLASASSWANLRNSKGSLSFEINEILNSGLKDLSQDQKLVINSVPNKTLSNSNDNDYCKSKLDKTTQKKITYSPKSFASVDDLNDWIGDFSQGDGKEGSDMYKKCDRSCSPQYQYSIAKDANDLKLEVEVICGLPRDKDDNQYSVVAQCVAK